MVSSWKAISDFISVIPPRGKGVIVDWHQQKGMFFVGGHSKLVRLWDAEKEMCALEFPTRIGCGITALRADVSGCMLAAGFQDGTMRMYDLRMAPQEAYVYIYFNAPE